MAELRCQQKYQGQAMVEYLLVASALILVLTVPFDLGSNESQQMSLIEYFNQSLNRNIQSWEFGTLLAD